MNADDHRGNRRQDRPDHRDQLADAGDQRQHVEIRHAHQPQADRRCRADDGAEQQLARRATRSPSRRVARHASRRDARSCRGNSRTNRQRRSVSDPRAGRTSRIRIVTTPKTPPARPQTARETVVDRVTAAPGRRAPAARASLTVVSSLIEQPVRDQQLLGACEAARAGRATAPAPDGPAAERPASPDPTTRMTMT